MPRAGKRPAKRANAWDMEVGRRIRVQRLARDISQTVLGDGLGITFQQVQKYEKGVNRISAGRLKRICEILEVPITYFYDTDASTGTSTSGRVKAAYVFRMLQSRDALQMLSAFNDVRDGKLRRAFVRLVESVGSPRKQVRK